MSLEDCRLREVPLLGSVSERLERCCFLQSMLSPNLGATHTETVQWLWDIFQDSIFYVPTTKKRF